MTLYLVFEEAFAGPGRSLKGAYDTEKVAKERMEGLESGDEFKEYSIDVVELNEDLTDD